MKRVHFILFLFLIFGCKPDQELIVEPTKTEMEPNRGEEAGTRQRTFSAHNPISACEAFNLKYFIDPTCAGTLYSNSLIISAFGEYNQLGTSIRFTRTTNEAEADMVVDCVTGNSCSATSQSSILGVDTPSGGDLGTTITLTTNTVFTDCVCTKDPNNCNFTGSLSPCFLKGIVMHEIGHNLGIAHNEEERGVKTDVLPGTPDGFDPGSVFNSGPSSQENCSFCLGNCNFNENDIAVIEFLHPCNPCEVLVEIDSGPFNPGQTIQVTSTPGTESPYRVWAVFEGIPTRFLVHSHCGSGSITTDFTLENDPIMSCNMQLYVEQCGQITASWDYELNAFPNDVAVEINPANPTRGQTIEVTSNPSAASPYEVWAVFEGISSRFFVHENSGGQPLTTSFTLEDDPIMECNMDLWIVNNCEKNDTYTTFPIGGITTVTLDLIDNNNYPTLGESVTITSAGNGNGDYRILLTYSMNGQAQTDMVVDLECSSSSSTIHELWSTPGLEYSNVLISAVRNDGLVLGTKNFTIFP